MIYLTDYGLQTSTVISKRLIIKAETLKLIPFQVVEDDLGGCTRRSVGHWESLVVTVKIFSLARVRLETKQKLKKEINRNKMLVEILHYTYLLIC